MDVVPIFSMLAVHLHSLPLVGSKNRSLHSVRNSKEVKGWEKFIDRCR